MGMFTVQYILFYNKPITPYGTMTKLNQNRITFLEVFKFIAPRYVDVNYFVCLQVPSALESFTHTCLSIVNKKKKNLSTLCQIRHALTYFGECSMPDSGSMHTIQGKGSPCGACWEMTTIHRQTQP